MLAMKHETEFVCGLRYKLQVMDISVEDPMFVFDNNQSVLVINTNNSGSMIKKKMHSIAFHFIRERYARNEGCTAYINTAENITNLLPKPLPSGEKH